MQLEKNKTVYAYFPEKNVYTTKSINSACRLLKNKIEKSRAKIIFNDLIPLRIHHADQVMIFKELISNSIKFANKKSSPEIYISSQYFGCDTVYRIEDNGIGIPVEFWGQCFGNYKKIYHNILGQGNGLALVKAILDNYNGSVWVGESSNEGTTIYFSIGS